LLAIRAVIKLSLSADWENLYTCDLSSYSRAHPRNFSSSVMEAWPFLFSKSAGMERKVIVMPEVLRGEDAARLIAHVTAPTLSDGETKAGEALFLREMPHSTLGPLHVVFRNRRATASDLGDPPDDLFPEWVTEGFIARGAEPRFASIAEVSATPRIPTLG
jgi:hypothetical protein